MCSCLKELMAQTFTSSHNTGIKVCCWWSWWFCYFVFTVLKWCRKGLRYITARPYSSADMVNTQHPADRRMHTSKIQRQKWSMCVVLFSACVKLCLCPQQFSQVYLVTRLLLISQNYSLIWILSAHNIISLSIMIAAGEMWNAFIVEVLHKTKLQCTKCFLWMLFFVRRAGTWV